MGEVLPDSTIEMLKSLIGSEVWPNAEKQNLASIESQSLLKNLKSQAMVDQSMLADIGE